MAMELLEAFKSAREKAKRIYPAILYARAVNRASAKKFALAMSDLNRIYAVMSPGGPTALVPVVANILTSLVALRLGDYTLSLRAAAVGAQQLRSGNSPDARRYNSAERLHLMGYSRIVAGRAAYLGGLKFPEDEFNIESPIRAGDQEVSSLIRTTFPIAAEHTDP